MNAVTHRKTIGTLEVVLANSLNQNSSSVASIERFSLEGDQYQREKGIAIDE